MPGVVHLALMKQIPQIQQIVARLGERYGAPVAGAGRASTGVRVSVGGPVGRLYRAELRDRRMGFRARYLRETARRVAVGIRMPTLAHCSLPEARLR